MTLKSIQFTKYVDSDFAEDDLIFYLEPNDDYCDLNQCNQTNQSIATDEIFNCSFDFLNAIEYFIRCVFCQSN